MISNTPLLFIFLALVVVKSWAWVEPIKTRNEQCLDDVYDGACDFEEVEGVIEYSCEQLRCARKVGNDTFIPRYGKQPVDGTYCGESQICLNRKCQKVDKMPKHTGPETKVNCN